MVKIEMKALQYQSVPQGNEKQYADTDGKFFVFSEQEALARVERRLAERVSPEAPTEEEAEAAQVEDDLERPWTLQMLPAPYLEKYGEDAKHSAHARAVLARWGKA